MHRKGVKGAGGGAGKRRGRQRSRNVPSARAGRQRRAAWRQSAENARLRHRKRKPLMAFTASTVK
ncbi:hypothetical protein K0M31_010720 [Melipona bicolor]|uniref:Uncharacterized protein n=1 Tax=Melipona bicolor TaxID=60889 RepID=A0AA40FLH9_9HYME|nr:hypothetical protein K0M31_010720 [Melipona bicolor]